MKSERKILVATAVVAVDFREFHLGDQVRIAAQTRIGPRPNEGFWTCIPQLLLYSTFTTANIRPPCRP